MTKRPARKKPATSRTKKPKPRIKAAAPRIPKPKTRKPPANSSAGAERLDPKRAEFARQYLLDYNAAAAARRAGYATGSAKVTACRMLADDLVQAEIQRLIAARNHRLDISADRTLRELAAIGYARMSDFYDAEGHAIPLHLLPDHVVAAIQAVETTETDGKLRHKLRLVDRKGTLELLGRHQGLFRAGMLPDGSGGEVPPGTPGAPIHVAGEVRMVIERRVVHVQQESEPIPAPAPRTKR